MRKSMLYIFPIFISLAILSESDEFKWGKEEGSFNWKAANEVCKATGMRLPNKKELLSLYKSTERKNWAENWYWTGDELDTERAWIVVLNVGAIVHIPKHYNNFVRCIR